jgi:hypothetical protein
MRGNKLLARGRCIYEKAGRYVGVHLCWPTQNQLRWAFFMVGIGLLMTGMVCPGFAAEDGGDGLVATYNPERVDLEFMHAAYVPRGQFRRLGYGCRWNRGHTEFSLWAV